MKFLKISNDGFNIFITLLFMSYFFVGMCVLEWFWMFHLSLVLVTETVDFSLIFCFEW